MSLAATIVVGAICFIMATIAAKATGKHVMLWYLLAVTVVLITISLLGGKL